MREADIDRTLRRAEEYLERYGGSREAREASIRAVGRTARGIGTRITRSVGAMGVTGAGLGGYGIVTTGIVGIDLLIAGAFAVPAVGALAFLIPTRGAPEPRKFTQAPLGRLASDAEAWLAAAKRQLPRAACREADAIGARLNELQPLLAERKPGDPEAIEARRLIADHLPRLVHAWLAVPPTHRAAAPDVERELTNGLNTIAGELGRLGAAMAATKLDALRVEGRFLESRYKEGQGTGA